MQSETRPLSQAVQLLYAELLQQCAKVLPGHRGVSFSRKTVKGKIYWYLEVVVGSGKKQYSIGTDSVQLRQKIEQQKALRQTAASETREREKLVAMLIQGGLLAMDNAQGRVLELLAQAGLFLSGGVLVGSHAFNAYQGMLGVCWATRLIQTGDIDLASEANMNIAIKTDAPDIKTTLLESGLSFFEIPALNPKSPSTSFKVRNKDLHVDLLTPLRGRNTTEPVSLKHFNSYAHPIRFLDYLLEDTQMAVLPFRGGVLVNVPSPARFAYHKLVIAERRPAAQQTKAQKDIRQAEMLFRVLLENRPGDVWLARDAIASMPGKFGKLLNTAVNKLPTDMRGQLTL